MSESKAISKKYKINGYYNYDPNAKLQNARVLDANNYDFNGKIVELSAESPKIAGYTYESAALDPFGKMIVEPVIANSLKKRRSVELIKNCTISCPRRQSSYSAA